MLFFIICTAGGIAGYYYRDQLQQLISRYFPSNDTKQKPGIKNKAKKIVEESAVKPKRQHVEESKRSSNKEFGDSDALMAKAAVKPKRQHVEESTRSSNKEFGDSDALRAEAKLHRKLMAQAFEDAKVAFEEDRKADAKYMSEKGAEHKQRYKEADQQAAQIVYREKNEGRPENEMDLHGLYVEEAMHFLEIKVKKLLEDNEGPITLDVITGRGRGSEKGIPKIKPEVKEWLDARGYKWEEANAGHIRTTLH